MSNYTYHGTTDLVTLPQRNVQTFPSGLVRVDRVYACRKTLADRFRRDLAVGNPLPFDDGTPAIDGLYIFPEPQEIRRDDGFVEFRVSAYGRTNTTGSQRPEFLRGSVFGLNFSFSQIIIENCLPSSTALRDLLESPPVELRFEIDPQNNPDPNVGDILRLVPIPKLSEVREGISQGGGTILIGGQVFTASYGGIIIERSSINFGIYQTAYIYASENPVIASSSSRNFGFFTEFTTTYGFDGSPIAITAFAGRWKINGVLV
jgi:hypothetical protein